MPLLAATAQFGRVPSGALKVGYCITGIEDVVEGNPGINTIVENFSVGANIYRASPALAVLFLSLQRIQMATGAECTAGTTGNELLSVGQAVDIKLKQNAASVALQSWNKAFRQTKSLLERLMRNTSFGYSARKRFGRR